MIINRLPQLMAQKGISIRQLSQLTAVTYTTIRAIYHSERRRVQLEILGAICQALGIQPGDIYQYVPEGLAYREPIQQAERMNDRTSQPDKTEDPHPRTKPKNNDWRNW